MNPLTTKWLDLPYSFELRFYAVWFSHNGCIAGYWLSYGAFTSLNEGWFSSMRLSAV